MDGMRTARGDGGQLGDGWESEERKKRAFPQGHSIIMCSILFPHSPIGFPFHPKRQAWATTPDRRRPQK